VVMREASNGAQCTQKVKKNRTFEGVRLKEGGSKVGLLGIRANRRGVKVRCL